MNNDARDGARGSADRVERDLLLAREAMDARVETLDAARRTKLWARIESQREEQSAGRFQRWWPAFAAAALASAVIAWSLWGTTKELAPDQVRVVRGVLASEDAQLELGAGLPFGEKLVARGAVSLAGAELELELASGVSLALSTPRTIALEDGVVTIAVVQPVEVVVVTPEARLSTLGGKLRVERTAGRTRADVLEGEVELSRLGKTAQTLRAGQFAVITEQAASAALLPPATDVAAAERAVEPAVEQAVEQAAEKPAREAKPAAKAAAKSTTDAPVPALASPLGSALEQEHDADARVEEARSWARRDAPRARALAEDVLDSAPAPAVRVRAEMVLADALRLEGRRERAAETYGDVAASPAAGVFLEEAMFRKAQLYAELGKRPEALSILGDAVTRVANPLLAPERTALTADLYLDEGRAPEAARVLEQAAAANATNARAVHLARLRVAKKLVSSDPARARRLLEVVLAGNDSKLSADAKAILSELPPGEAKNF